jgi:glycosyltransferase involved in cell wall biosynthesis
VKVALVHYWLVGMRGGERVLEALCQLYPEADIYTHVYLPDSVSELVRRHRVYTSFIARLPRAASWYPYYLPLMPMALETLDLSAYDLVISSESGPAKGVITAPGSLHVCYCHSPMRYLWDMKEAYFGDAGRLKRLAMAPLTHYLRLWDQASAARVDHFIANSHFVKQRIRKFYRRSATVIHPPVNVDGFTPGDGPEDYYLAVGQLVRYKRFDLAVAAFNRLGRKLVIIGDGTENRSLQRRAGPHVRFLGAVEGEQLVQYYRSCRALIFPGIEDFGIVPVEAMACGRPVVAYAAGGALETVIAEKTGVFFHEQTADALCQAVEALDTLLPGLDAAAIRQHAQSFNAARFANQMSAFIRQRQQLS